MAAKKQAKVVTQRGRERPDDQKAQAVAMLLLGSSVAEVSRTLGLPQSTVSTYKAQIPPEKFDELRLKKGDRLDELVYSYMVANLKALEAQAEVASDVEYIQRLSANELATLHGVMADKSVRFLGAATRPGAGQPQLGPGEEEEEP